MYTILTAILLTTTATPFTAQTVDGKSATGALSALDAKQVTIQTAEGPVSFGTDQLLHLSPEEAPPAAEAEAAAWIALADGSSLTAAEYTAAHGRALITLAGGRTVELPTGAVASVRLQPHSGELAAEWARILELKRDSDLLIVRKGNVVDYHRGVLGKVTDKVVEFEIGGDVLPVKRPKVHGLAYSRPPKSERPKAICRITDAAGSKWFARSIVLSGDLQWATPGGAKVAMPLEAIARIDFSAGKVEFLSDMKPESVTFTPYFGTKEAIPSLKKFFAPRNDTNLESGPLKLDGKTFGKGLALHTRTKMVYRLPGRFRRFQATVGIDDAVRPGGHVRLVISGDDKVLLETTVTGADPAKPVDLDLTGVRRLTILADFGEKLDVADHLDLCNARIIK